MIRLKGKGYLVISLKSDESSNGISYVKMNLEVIKYNSMAFPVKFPVKIKYSETMSLLRNTKISLAALMEVTRGRHILCPLRFAAKQT